MRAIVRDAVNITKIMIKLLHCHYFLSCQGGGLATPLQITLNSTQEHSVADFL